MISVLVHDRIDHHPVAHQTLLDDPLRQRRRADSLGATLTGSPLAPDHLDKKLVPGPTRAPPRLAAMIRSGSGAALTPSAQLLQARFSRRTPTAKRRAFSTSSGS